MSRRAWVAAGAVALAAWSVGASAARPVFDFVANRALAHGMRKGGLSILAGSAGFARYTRFGRPQTWKLLRSEDGRRVALASTEAILDVPLTAEQLAKPALTVRVLVKAASSVQAVVLGGAPASPAVALKPGWQTVTMPLGGLVAGENRLRLRFASTQKFGADAAAAAVEWLQIGGEVEGDVAPPASDAQALRLAKDGGLAWYVFVPPGASVQASGEAGGCALSARVVGRQRVLSTAPLTLGAPLSLAAHAGKVVRLELVADGAACAGATLKDVVLSADGEPATARYGRRPRNVVFWLTDSTRADKYRVINGKTRVETKVMDAFADKATVFTVAYVQGNESRVSHASIFTGMYPAQHKFIAERAKLSAALTTLPKAMAPLGLQSIGFMGNGFIRPSWGFDGWDQITNHIEKQLGLLAADFVAAAKGFLAQPLKKPFFLYLGTIDAHVSWRAHAPWIAKYDAEPYTGAYVKALLDPTLDKIVAGKVPLSDRDKVRVLALYDSDVSYNDQQFGELLKLLEQKGLMDDTLIVLTADHGEEMYDHGKIGHGQSLHEELVHVPLVIYYPPLFPPGKKVEEGVESVDILPTLVDALGGKPPADVQGESLVPLAQGVTSGYPRPAIASQYELAYTMRLNRWKLWVGGRGDTKLFDLVADPGGQHELGAEAAIERRFVSDAMSMWMAYQGRWKKSRWGVASNHRRELATDLEGAAK